MNIPPRQLTDNAPTKRNNRKNRPAAMPCLYTAAMALLFFQAAGLRAQTCQPVTVNLSQGQNYILETVPRVAGYNPAAAGNTNCSVMQTVQYFDGLGRPLQTVQVMASPQMNDVVQPVAYDAFGREPVKYLPYTSVVNDGSYKPGALTGTNGYGNSEQNTFYNSPLPAAGVSQDGYPVAQTAFEPSPLNRVVELGAPGAAWQLTGTTVTTGTTPGHTVKIIYTYNDGVKYPATLYTVNIDASGNRTLVYSSSNAGYAPGQLDVTVSQDENWTTTQSIDQRLNTTEEYKDKEGHVVLKRTYNLIGTATIQTLSTYYVYDDQYNLCFVLPPGALPDAGLTGANIQTTLNNFCYQYGYDNRNRLAGKQLPGKGVEYMVYNQLDQPVLSQDANQRLTNQWAVTKYDAQGRVIVTGLWNAGSAIAQATLQSSIYAGAQWDLRDYSNNTTANPTGYVITSYPQLNKTLTVNYYDDYSFTGQPAAFNVQPNGVSTRTTGLLTGTRTAVLNTITNTTPDMLWTVHYYDEYGRNIKSYMQHYLGGTLNAANYDAVSTTYNFTNAPTTVTRQHFNIASTTTPLLTIANTYIYDHIGRKLKTWEQITNGSNTPNPANKYLISQVVYNEAGQVWNKQLHSTDSVNFLQTVAYTYNERGWLLQSTSPVFEEQLQYNQVAGIAGISPVAQYNGNIASQSWGTGAAPNANSYVYAYDALNRLTGGTTATGNTENNITYDLMGNITQLFRYQGSAATLIDKLTYTYTNTAGYPTNQLQTLNDASGSSTGAVNGTSTFTGHYDANGNLTADPSKPTGTINIGYNLLNLPQTITGAKTITYTYDAGGQKLRRVSAVSGSTDYISGIEYDAGAVTFIQTEEGRAVPSGSASYIYDYYLADHLGNTRVTFDSHTTTASQIQKDDYYPFGMDINPIANTPPNNYLYNKKELQGELAEYDYGARFYDPVIARWTTPDPLAEKGRRWSPYNYGFDNPISHTDPDGMWPNPLVLLYDALFRKFTANTTSSFIKTGASNGVFNSGGIGITKVGRVYEDAVRNSLGENKNTRSFSPLSFGPKVVPDVVGGSVVTKIDVANPKNSERTYFPDASFVDVKFKSNVSLSDPNNPNQMKGMVDVLSNMKGGYVNGEWNANIKASDYGAATLTLITPSNATIGADLIDYATSKNVKLYQRVTQQDEDDPSRIRVAPNATPLNFVPTEQGVSVPKGPGQSAETNWK